MFSGVEIVGGRGSGQVLWADVGLSFWGGIDPLTGMVIDRTHPLFGRSVASAVLCIPNGRGSSTGSQVMLELLRNGVAPSAIVLRQRDSILALGVIVGEEIFGLTLPVVSLSPDHFASLQGQAHASVEGASVFVGESYYAVDSMVAELKGQGKVPAPSSADDLLARSELNLTVAEKAMLAGANGPAKQVAMRIVALAAAAELAPCLLPITQV